MLKKISRLTAALVAAAAVVLPGTTFGQWYHHGIPIVQNTQIGLTGPIRIQNGADGIECQVTSQLNLTPFQTTAPVESFTAHPTNATTNCSGRGSLALCQVHELKPLNLPWNTHKTEFFTTIVTEGGKHDTTGHPVIEVTINGITSTMTGAFCPMKHLEVGAGSAFLFPDKLKTVSSVQIHETSLPGEWQTLSGVVDSKSTQIIGELHFEEPNANTFSFVGS